MYKVIATRQAAKQLQKLPSTYVELIRQHIHSLADNPRPSGVKKLTNDLSYRLRVGDYRILYDVDDTAQLVTIYRIKHRKDVYR